MGNHRVRILFSNLRFALRPQAALALARVFLLRTAIVFLFWSLNAFGAAGSYGGLTNAASIAVWDGLFRGAADVGYRDNVSRTSVEPESSPFVHSSAEVSLIRLADTGSQLSLFLLGEDWRYLESSSVGYEQLASAMAQGSWILGNEFEAGGELQYIYQKQVVDASENDADLRRLLIEGHGFWARPRWRWNWHSAWYCQIEGTALRQLFGNDELDDYLEPSVRVSVAHKYGNRSEVSAGIQTTHRFFDSREQTDTFGSTITNSSLSYWRPEIGAQVRHFWDARRHWRTTTKVSYLWNQDNGTGYYDYDRFLLSQQARWGNDAWDIKANARIGWYGYRTQKVGSDSRDRSYFALDLRIERRLTRKLFVFASAEREWDFSNDPLDEYRDWSASAGVGVEF